MAGSGVAPDGWQPAFPGQRPPFGSGNFASLRHGAFSHRLTGPFADSIAAEQLSRDDCPLWLQDPSYASAVTAWTFAEAECVGPALSLLAPASLRLGRCTPQR